MGVDAMEEGIWGLYHKYSGAELHVGRLLMEYRCIWVRKDGQKGLGFGGSF